MIRYTTPTYLFSIAGVDLTGMEVFVTFSQNGRTLTVEDPIIEVDESGTVISCELTQEQSAAFHQGDVRVQINWVDPVGKRDATIVKTIPVLSQLLQEVK